MSEPIPGVPKLKPNRIIDAHRAITFYKALPASSEGKEFELQTKVIGAYDKGKAGTVLEQETVLREKRSKEVYVKLVGSTFFIGQGNWGGPKGGLTSIWYQKHDCGDLLERRPKSSQLPSTKGQETRWCRNPSNDNTITLDIPVCRDNQ